MDNNSKYMRIINNDNIVNVGVQNQHPNTPRSAYCAGGYIIILIDYMGMGGGVINVY